MPAADPRSGSLFPYLLRDMTIERPNQVWATDITYTAVSGHRAFVIGIIDLFSRKVMAYNVVNTMDAWYCVETLQEAVRRYGRPEIFNSDQGSQFTSAEFIRELNWRVSVQYHKFRCHHTPFF